MELVIPKLEEILAIVNINYVIVNSKEEKNEDYGSKDEENTNININSITKPLFIFNLIVKLIVFLRETLI